MAEPPPTHSPAAPPSRAPLVVHVTLILLVLLFSILSATVYATPDANIGLGMGAFGFVALGLPWGLAFLVLPEQNPGLTGLDNVFAAGGVGTLLNLGLHYYVWRRRTRAQG